MLTRFSRLSLLASVLVFIAGCGGSSGGGGSNGGGASPTIVSFSFSGAKPTIVAARVGSGSFAPQPLSGSKLSLSIPGGTSNYAVAWMCTTASSPTFQEVFEASVADGSSFRLPCLSPLNSGTSGTLTGNVDVSAISKANLVNIAVDDGNTEFKGSIVPDTNFSVSAPAGNDRVEVLAYQTLPPGQAPTAVLVAPTLVAAKNFSNQIVPGALNGGSQVVLGAGDETTSQTIAYSNVPSGYSVPSTQVSFSMAGQADFSIAIASTQYPVLPAGAVATGDFYRFFSTAANTAKPTEMTNVSRTAASPGAVSLKFPSPWIYAGPTPAALPSFDFSYPGFTGNDGVFDTGLLAWTTSNGLNEYLVIASANYLGGSTSVAFPDLSHITGFMAQPPSGTRIIWAALITQSSLGVLQPISSNATIVNVGNGGIYAVP